MKSKFFTLLRGSIAIFAILSGSVTHGQDTKRFKSVQAARDYLVSNPTGPRAREAFSVIVGDRVAEKYPEYPRSGKVPAKVRSVARGADISAAQVDAAFDESTTYY